MNLLVLLLITSCVALDTTTITSPTIISNSTIKGQNDVFSSFYDMTQIRHAIENAEEILKLLHKKPKPIRARPEQVVKFYCANPGRKHFTQIYFDDSELDYKLDTSKPIVFIIHGWMDNANSEWVIDLSEVWISNHDTNVCRVDWSLYSNTEYIVAAVTKIRVAAGFIADFIKSLNSKHKMSYKRMTIAGHSMGAHVSGLIGQRLKSRIGKIFGLDPAGPLFTVPIIVPIEYRLDATDAKKVIIIHSCDGVLGVNIACGYQDFYANKGKFPQKGCAWPHVEHAFEYRTDPILCAHFRAVQYLIEALQPHNKCYGIKCNSLVNYLLRSCTYSEQLRVDDIKTPGRYYFTTSNANCTDIIAVSWEEWWTYDGISGPAFWGLINPEWSLCNRGRRQSPVNLEPQRLLFDPNLRPVHIDKHRISGMISNTGHSVIFTVDNETVIQYGTSPQIPVNLTGGPLSYKYRFQEIHVHYGLHDQFGSEHSVEGYTFPAEIQLFGYNSQLYSNFSDALNRAQGIVGVSVLLQLGDLSNPELRMLTDQLEKIRYGGDEAPVRRISIRGLLPETDHYMTYEGSTTAPACHETVTWIVLNKPIYITKQQMHALRRLMQGSPDHPKAPLGNNFRPPQQLYHRPVRTNIDFRGKQNGKICPTMYRDVHYKANSWKQH